MQPNQTPPNGWQRKRIADLFNVRASGDIDWSRWSNEQDATHPHPVYANGRADSGLHGYASYAVEKGDAVTLTARGTLGELGYAFFRSTSFTPIGRLLVLRSKGEVDARFFASYINGLVRFAQENTGVAQLTAPQVTRYQIDLPPLSEQHAIAAALSDVDALIAGLEKLIAKKRDLKQAAMQQLLTCQTRLPGFSGEWVVKSLGDIANIKTGSRNNENKVEDGLYPFFVRSAHVERINTYSHECEAILVPGEGQIGNIFHYINGRFDVHQRVYAITQFIEGVSGQYIHFFISQHFGEWAMQNTVKATVDSLRLPTFQTFQVQLPPTHEEQAAIAEALSDMNDEFIALESRLAKTRELKQGMMKELLTGRTRLPEVGEK